MPKERLRLATPADRQAIAAIHAAQMARLGRRLPLPEICGDGLTSAIVGELAGKIIGAAYFELEMGIIATDPRFVATIMRPENVQALKYHARETRHVASVRLFPERSVADTLGKRAARAGFIRLDDSYGHYYLNLQDLEERKELEEAQPGVANTEETEAVHG